jgi:hypothetical protein
MKKVVLVVFVAVLLGLVIGPVTAMLRARHAPPIGGAKVEVGAVAFDFGEMDSAKDGSHEFTFWNRGTAPLILTRGATSCRCTVSEIADPALNPGQSTTVRVTWKSKHAAGPFMQSVTIGTSDPGRPEVTLTIKGEFTEPLHIVPDELTFGQIIGDTPVACEARIFSRLPNCPVKIVHEQFTDLDLAKYFQVDIRPLTDEELRPAKGAVSGVLVKVTAKPGLPPGRFQQRILLRTNLPSAPEVDLPLFGSIGKDVSVAGAGWDDDIGVLNVGLVKAHTAAQRQLILFARGTDAKDVRYNVVHVDPDFLKVKLGKTTLSDDGKLSQTMLTIEIPPRNAPASYMGDDHDKLAEIHIDTTSPQVHQLRIRVRFAVEDGK